MAKVYLSSTLVDLRAERDAVTRWLTKANHQVRHSYVADDESVRESCLADIDDCDAYVLILGHRYGFIPRTDNPEQLSITHLEFRHAGSHGIPRVALLRTSIPDTSLSDVEDPERYQRVIAFRAEVGGGDALRPALFADEASLIEELSAGLQNVLAKRRTPPAVGGAKAPPVSPPRLRQPQHAIVGRDQLIHAVLERLRQGRREFAFVVLPGVGKTAVAAELIRNQAIAERFPDGVLWAHLGSDPDVSRELRKWATKVGLPDDRIDKLATVDDLGDAIADTIGQWRLLLVVDDVWSTEAGARFRLGGANCAYLVTTRYPVVARELMPTVDDVIAVPKLSTDDGLRLLAELAPHCAALAPGVLRRLVQRVDGLPIALVLIGSMLKAGGDDERAIQSVERSLDDSAAMFGEKMLASDTLGQVIEASYTALGSGCSLNEKLLFSGDDLRRALEALSVLRPDPSWFPSTLATRITGLSARALEVLANRGLIEEVRYEGKDAERHERPKRAGGCADAGAPAAAGGQAGDEGADDRRYTMHRVVAEYIRGKLAPERYQTLVHLAADHYLQRLRALEEVYQEGDATTYSAMYRYEDPEWQDSQDNWLYYFAQSGYDAEANLIFLQVWFDGFWWWGCFTDEGFDFCDQLLREWQHRLTLSAAMPSPLDSSERIGRRVQGLELLRRFKRAYPKETEDRHGGSWPDVTSALRVLRRLTAIDGDAEQLTHPSARHVRALTDIFLAEAKRFGDDDVGAAAGYYREAQALFHKDGDDWNVAWALYHHADMLAERGRYPEARPLCEEALNFGRAGNDHEVVALACRVLGDAAFAAGDAAAARHHYHLALTSAYRFQVDPRPPDDYTLRFYADMALALAERLRRGRAGAAELAVEVANGLRAVWLESGVDLPAVADAARLLADADATTLAAHLFPAPLATERRAAEGETYAATVCAHLKALGD